jgi:hypothetical protein
MKKTKAIQKIAPFALGMMVCSSQIAQMPLAYGASLKSMSAAADPLLKPVVPEPQSFPSAAAPDCVSAPVDGGSSLPQAGAESLLNASNSSALNSSGSPSVLASSVTGAVVPSALTAQATGIESSSLIAQVPALEDCCAIGGTTTCEVGGVPPVGGAALAAGGLSPLLGLLATPLLAIPALVGGGDGGGNGGDVPTPPTPPVPEPSSTAAITAALGLFGLWYGRRFRIAHKTSL